MEIDKLAKYKTSPEEYDKFLKRLRHIVAVFLGYPVEEEPCILINGSSPRYEKQTGLINFEGYINGSSSRYEKRAELINFDGHFRRFAGSGVELYITCPFSFVDRASDEEISSWIKTIIDKRMQISKDKSDNDIPVERVLEIGRELQNEDKWHGAQYETVKLLCDTIERLQGKSQRVDVNLEKPLSTNTPLSKDQLIEYLQKADIPGDAECTLQFDKGKFYLYFYWSEDAGAFGHTAVNFDIESKELVEDAWSYMEKD